MPERPDESGRPFLPRRFVASLAPLRQQSYRRLWVGRSISSAGDSLTLIASVFAVLAIGGNAAEIGYIAAIQALTRTTFVLVGGVWADRLRRQYVILTADVIRAIVQASLAALLLLHRARIWELAVGAAIFGAAKAFAGPASSGLLPETVSREQLQDANALLSFTGSFFEQCGPAVGGLLIAGFGPGLLYALDAASFVVSAISLGTLKLKPRELPDRGSFWADLRVGWQEMAIRPWYWLNLITHALWNFAIPAMWVLGPVIALKMLGGASSWGLIAAAWAAGGTVGGIISLRARPRRPLIAANLALVLTALPLLALARPLGTWAIAVTAVAGGSGVIFLNTVWDATMQQLIPAQVRSRVNSYDRLISYVVMPAGYAVVGPLAAAFGFRATVLAFAVLLGGPSCLVILIPGIRAVRRTKEGRIIQSVSSTRREVRAHEYCPPS